MLQGFFGEVDATEHACHFLDPLRGIQAGHGGAGLLAAALFMHEQVFMEYARQFLEPEQIDAVDIDALMSKAGLTI